METLLEILRWATTVAFVGLAVVTGLRWSSDRSAPNFWMLLTFVDLGAIAVIGRFLPEETEAAGLHWVVVAVIAILLLFPYFLYRVAAAFTRGSRIMDAIAVVLTAVVVVWSVLLPEFPGPDEPQTAAFQAFVNVVLLQWVLLSTIVAIRFWRGGRDQPAVARRRMRALSAASVLLSLGIVVSALAPSGGARPAEVDIVIQLISLVSVLFFFFAFAPPRWVRAAWRRQSEESLRRAIIDLMGAVTDEAVIDGLLPHAASIIGGEGIAILDKDGRPIGTYGITDEQWDTIRAESGKERDGDAMQTALAPDITKLDFPFGSLVVRTSVYTPYFGRDEIDLLGSLGVMANLALERVRASEMRLELAEAQLRRAQALEINDNVVQGLAVAKYAMDLGQLDKAQEAVEGTLAAARRIISDLLEEIGDDDSIFGPDALVRDRAATGFTQREL
ncbi:MAG: hypothetical protein ACRDKT_02690 [Actinomycetota bacterium]